jgi:hypothetical protein
MVEVLNQIKRLTNKYQVPYGLAVWGFTAAGQAREILVDEEGRLVIGAVFAGTVDVPNIDVLLSTRASESTLSTILARLDITTSALRDDLRGAGTRDFTTLEADVESVLGRLDVLLSTRAAEATVEASRVLLDELTDALASVGTDSLQTVSV